VPAFQTLLREKSLDGVEFNPNPLKVT
jgi:hypothetical protein